MPGKDYRVKVVLEKIRVLDVHDPCWLGLGEIRFMGRVTVSKDKQRATYNRLPLIGTYKMRASERMIGSVIFDGFLGEQDSLEVAITGVKEDFLGPDDRFERYRRFFHGKPETWAGSYQPGDEKDDPEAKADWEVWYRIEVSKATATKEFFPAWSKEYIQKGLSRVRTDFPRRIPGFQWIKAIEHKQKMTLLHPDEGDPGGTAPHTGHRSVLIDAGGKETPLESGKHPAKGHIFADPNRIVVVSGKGRMKEAVVKIGVAIEELTGINPDTLRLFRWDERRGGFRLVARSGLGEDGTYVWGRINTPGLYGVFGLPADRARLDTARLICTLRPWARLADTLPEGAGVLWERLCGLILCPGIFTDVLTDPEALQKMGLEDEIGRDLAQYGEAPTDAKGKPAGMRPLLKEGPARFTGDLCEACYDVTGGVIDEMGGVECQLLDDPHIRFPILQRGCEQWYSLGPDNRAGRVKSLAWHPTNANIVYAGVSQGGVYRSMDRGYRWQALWSDQIVLSVGSLAISPSHPLILYAGTGEYGVQLRTGVGIYKTTDGGDHWDLLTGTVNEAYSKIVVHPTDLNVVYAAGTNGVERSMDGGRSWQTILLGAVSDIEFDPSDPGVLYAGCEDARRVQRLANAQAQNITPADWIDWNNGLSQGTAQNHFIKLAATLDANGQVVLWCQMVINPSSNFNAYRWNGNAWDLRLQNPDSTQGRYNSVLAIEPGNPDVVYSCGTAIRRTVDGGQLWSDLAHFQHADQHDIAFDPSNPRRVLVANDGGISIHTRNVNDPDDRAYEQDSSSRPLGNAGMRTIQFYNISVSQRGTFGVGGSTQDQGILFNKIGVIWDGLPGVEWGPLEVFAQDGNIVMWDPHNNIDPVLQRTEDGGQTSRNANNGLGTQWVHRLAMHPTDSNIVLAATPWQSNALPGSLFRSTDGGAPPPATGFTNVLQLVGVNHNTTDIAFAPSDPTIVYMVTNRGDIYRSDNTGEDWVLIGNGPGNTAFISSIAIDWNDPDLIYITYAGNDETNPGAHISRHVYSSEDAGTHWIDISGARPFTSLPDIPTHRLIVDNRDSQTYYVATVIGIFRTTDGGDWWYPFDEGLPNAVVTDIAYRPASQRLFVSTYGRGAYYRRI